MNKEQHFDVAAYALGVLDERDSARFEDHLIECGACAIELESLLPVLGAVIPEASGFAPKALELIGKGAPLRIDKLVELQSVATTEIDPKRFDLPAPVITAMEFLSAMSPGETGEGFLPLP